MSKDKDKDKAAGKARKKDKKARGGAALLKMPKEVGGVKVPKGLRKAGKAALKLAETPVVSQAVAAAMLGAAAALRAPPKGPKPNPGGDAPAEPVAAPANQPNPLGDALRAMAIDVARRAVTALEDSAKAARKPGGEGR